MKLSLKEKLIYATGNMGVSLVTVIHMLFLVYFFFPSNNAMLSYVIPQGSILIIFTVLGLILFGSRMFDAVTDPLIASLSDKSKNRKGKRIPFMRKAALPMAISYVAVFFVPFINEVHVLNVVWLAVFMVLSALFLTLYSVPYYTLMVDMGKDKDDLVDLGTYASAFWFVGFLIVSFATALWVPFEDLFGVTRVESIQMSFVMFGLLGFVLMMVPTFFLKEKDYETKTDSNRLSFKESLRTVSKNKSYMLFFVGNTAYNVATYIFETGLIYFITVLALLNESVQGPLTTIIGVLTLLCYPLINKIAKKHGKRPIMLIGFTLFTITFVVISFLGLGSINPMILLGAIVLLSPFSQAAFGILPGVMTADCANYDKYVNKEDHAGMYVAATGFSQKLGGSLATIIFTSFLLLGKDVDADLGIRLVVIFAAVLSIVGILTMLRYNEKEVLSYSDVMIQDSDLAE